MPADRRIRRTRKLLRAALIALVLERGYRNITIQEVAARADIGYRTFFRHYDGLDDLLMDVVHSVIDELDTRFDLFRPEANLPGVMTRKGEQLFAYVRDHEPLFRMLLLDHGVRFVLEPVLKRLRDRVEATLPPATTADIPPAVVANHVVVSTLALIGWWLERDLPYDTTTMGRLFVDLIIRPLWNQPTNKPMNQ